MSLFNKETWTVPFIPLSLLVIISFSSIANSAVITEPPQYGAPYYNTSRYSYGGHPGNTVSEAIDNWWAAYRAYWGVNCSYDLTLYDDGYTSGYFAHMQLKNGCGGGDTIVGTAYCSNGLTLINSQCVGQLPNEKNLGAPDAERCP